MATFRRLALCLALAAVPSASAGVELKRTSLVVRDLDRALALYRDVLGFKADAPRVQSTGANIGRALRLPAGSTVTFVPLTGGDGEPSFGLIAHDGASSAGLPFRATIALVVDDLGETLSKLEAKGYRTGDVAVLRPTGGTVIREGNFIDADGHLVLLQERAREATPARRLANRMIGRWTDPASGERLSVLPLRLPGGSPDTLRLEWRDRSGAPIRERVWSIRTEGASLRLDYFTVRRATPDKVRPPTADELVGYSASCVMTIESAPDGWRGRIDERACSVTSQSGRTFAFAVTLEVSEEPFPLIAFEEHGTLADGSLAFRVPKAGRQRFVPATD